MIVLDFMPNGDMKRYLDYLVVRSETHNAAHTANISLKLLSAGVKIKFVYQVSS